MKKVMFLCFAVFLVCIITTVCKQEKSSNRIISERLITQIYFSPLMKDSFIVSPDGKRVAYGAFAGNRVFLVVDGKEGKQYDSIINFEGGKIVFSSSNSIYYLAVKGSNIYLVEETIK